LLLEISEKIKYPFMFDFSTINVSKRITIMLDDDLIKQLHDIQAKQIRDSSESVSFSTVLNETLRKTLKK